MFDIELLPANEGDALWLRYGRKSAPRHVLIDAGRASTHAAIRERVMALPEAERRIELFVVTHVDRDHIEGALKVLEDDDIAGAIQEVWFNGYDHLLDDRIERFGAVQGERLTTLLIERGIPWNAAFDGGPVRLEANADLPEITLDGGLKLTVLSPDARKLARLEPQWLRECEDAGLIPGTDPSEFDVPGVEQLGPTPDVEQLAARPVEPDTTLPNGSSIALLAEYRRRSILLGADAHIDRLTASIKTVKGGDERLKLDAFKLPHHGSSKNLAREILELVDCDAFLVSTSGAYFKHPTAAAIARVLKWGGKRKTLYFNYASPFTTVWDDEDLKAEWGYDAVFPDAAGRLIVELDGESA